MFSDATSEWSPETLRGLALAVCEDGVALASGRVMYRYGQSLNARGFKLYQRYLVALRRAERALGSQASVSGACHAIRAENFRPVAPEHSYDLCHPLHVAMDGRRTVYVDEAVCWEEARDDGASEFRARVRAAIIAYTFLPYLLRNLPRVQHRPYVAQILTHKVARWLAPVGLAASLPASAWLARRGSVAGATLLGLQLAGYGAVAGAWGLRRLGVRLPGAGAPLLFASTNVAFLVGLKRYLGGQRMATWNTAEQRT